MSLGVLQTRGRFVDAVGGDERLAGGQFRTRHFHWRHAAGLGQGLHHADRAVVVAATNRELDPEHPQRPFVPAHRLPAERAVGLEGVAEVVLRFLVGAPHQMNLRERVEDCAGGFMELDGVPDLECALEGPLGAVDIAKLHQNLPERGERHGQPVSGPACFMQGHAALGQDKGLFVLVAQQRDIGLVVHDPGEDIVGLNGHGEALALPERC